MKVLNYFILLSMLLLFGCDSRNKNDSLKEMTNVPREDSTTSILPSTSSFATFDGESSNLSMAVECVNPRIIDKYNPPALWQCIGGSSETVKLWVNESESAGQVRNVKFMWNDWIVEGGYGLHADQRLANQWASKIIDRYAPNEHVAILSAFNGQINKSFSNDKFDIQYTYDQGPGIGERMIIITSR